MVRAVQAQEIIFLLLYIYSSQTGHPQSPVSHVMPINLLIQDFLLIFLNTLFSNRTYFSPLQNFPPSSL